VWDVQRLRTFALVVDLGSISAAATVLGYTQSAVALSQEPPSLLLRKPQRDPRG
jgi:hypothetical protein